MKFFACMLGALALTLASTSVQADGLRSLASTVDSTSVFVGFIGGLAKQTLSEPSEGCKNIVFTEYSKIKDYEVEVEELAKDLDALLENPDNLANAEVIANGEVIGEQFYCKFGYDMIAALKDARAIAPAECKKDINLWISMEEKKMDRIECGLSVGALSEGCNNIVLTEVFKIKDYEVEVKELPANSTDAILEQFYCKFGSDIITALKDARAIAPAECKKDINLLISSEEKKVDRMECGLSQGLSVGAIAGIVIGALVVVVGTIFFALRSNKRSEVLLSEAKELREFKEQSEVVAKEVGSSI